MDRSNDTWHRLLVKFTLSGVEKHGVWTGSEEEAKALAKAEIESNYPSFNIDNIEFIDEKQEDTNNEVNQAQMRQVNFRYYCPEAHYLGQFASPKDEFGKSYCKECGLNYSNDELEVLEF